MKERVRIRPQAGHPVSVSKVRLFGVFAGIVLLAVITLGKLVAIQLVHHRSYEERAHDQYTNKRKIEPERGLILDRNDQPLVANLSNYKSVGVRLQLVKNHNLFAHQIADILEMDFREVYGKIRQKGRFVWINRKVDPYKAGKLRELKNKAIVLEHQTVRKYPFEKTASQIIGSVTIDNVGNDGLERTFDELLSGREGWEVVQRDAHQREILDPAFPRQDAVNGGELTLSIDITAQAIAEEELEKEVEKIGAKGGMIVVTRPNTGEILAIASSPRYNPNSPESSKTVARKNRAITDVYEPGSTFKAVPFAALLEHDLLDIDEIVFCENGRYQIADRVLRDSHRNGWLSARQVLAKSSNIGTAKLADRLTSQSFYTCMRDFGFGQESGIELPGEVRGILPQPSRWSGVSQANMSMGHGIAVTPLQLAMAYGAIANGGYLMRPLLVTSAMDPDGNTDVFCPQVMRRVIRPQTSRVLRRLLTDAVELGTGIGAQIEGLQVAGKTGTAQKVDQKNRTYYQDRYVASFAGFLPADRPELLAVVVIDDPKTQHYGSTVAVPVFHRVMKRLLITLPREIPEYDGDLFFDNKVVEKSESGVTVPDLVGLKVDQAIHRLKNNGLKGDLVGAGEWVSCQSLPAGSRVAKGQKVRLILMKKDQGSVAVVPDVCGLSLRKAVAAMSQSGIEIRIEGSGMITSQSLKPGTRIKSGSVCVLVAKHQEGVSS